MFGALEFAHFVPDSMAQLSADVGIMGIFKVFLLPLDKPHVEVNSSSPTPQAVLVEKCFL